MLVVATCDKVSLEHDRRMEKLAKRFVDPYKIKKIVSLNVVELELPSIIRIYSVRGCSKIT